MIMLTLIVLALVYVLAGTSVLLQVAWWGGILLASVVAVRLLSEVRHTRRRTTDQMEALGSIPDLMRRRQRRVPRTEWGEVD